MIEDFKINRDEYLFLREEIMLRTEWHLNFTKNATTMSISIWGGVFALIAYSLDKDVSYMVICISKFILLLPIFIMYPLSKKIYENYINFCNIGAYLIKFHEKPIHENDGTFFSWETAHSALLANFRANKPAITKAMDKSNSELFFLSCISLVLFLLFSGLDLKYYNHYGTIPTSIASIAAAIAVMILIAIIDKKSSYKCLEELSKAAQEFWGSYPKDTNNKPKGGFV